MVDTKTKVATTVAAAGVWALLLWASSGRSMAEQFAMGYAMEWVLSLDNLMAIYLVFQYFQLPKGYEPRILSYGLISAAAFRLIFTLIGTGLWSSYGRAMEVIFGVLVAATAVKMLTGTDDAKMVDHNERWYVRTLRRWIPVTGDVSQPVFFARKFETEKFMLGTGPDKWTWAATPLLACLVAVEVTDLIFSFDSVPAVIAVSRTPLVIYSAMIFAIVGLRQLYMLMPVVSRYFTALPQTVAAVLVVVALKMTLSGLLNIQVPTGAMFMAIVGLLAVGAYHSVKESKHALLKK